MGVRGLFPARAAAANLSSLVHATEDASGTFTTVQINTASSGQAAHWVNIAQLDGIAVGDTINVNLDPSHPATALQIHSETASTMTLVAAVAPAAAPAAPVGFGFRGMQVSDGAGTPA